ncbi:pentapeptide repeat-containing protein [Paucibacter sp. DJ2R-2]|uniref:pentapeptide repeat-containing protein n=1 Tax=Paucibacter sp. DJ2R-2 TaxID=2893558 RepID=UPI0021E3B3A7|nr:pentapeptide repeat-containing protein [Paucibacter sp. DJ2R-2]MCV2420908.1 pentapeptide repeat-containing protein [Paucibacter sp. DJ4R-1]MCV2440107.1 pentapeptide repeat-containing protein [Paucibacter sp. DJ2R-2]
MQSSAHSWRVRSHHSLNRTRNGMPPTGLVLFWPCGVLPLLAVCPSLLCCASDQSTKFVEEKAMTEGKKLQYINCRLSESVFEDVDLSKSRLSNVSLREAQFEDVTLANATFRNACFENVSIEDANVVGMKINGILVTDLLSVYEK